MKLSKKINKFINPFFDEDISAMMENILKNVYFFQTDYARKPNYLFICSTHY